MDAESGSRALSAVNDLLELLRLAQGAAERLEHEVYGPSFQQAELIAQNFLANGRPLFNEKAYQILTDQGKKDQADRYLYSKAGDVLPLRFPPENRRRPRLPGFEQSPFKYTFDLQITLRRPAGERAPTPCAGALAS